MIFELNIIGLAVAVAAAAVAKRSAVDAGGRRTRRTC